MAEPQAGVRKNLILPRHTRNHGLCFTISLVGVGGTGSFLLQRLAKVHLALQSLGLQGLFVTAYDDDLVEPHNVVRQHFKLSDVRQNKAEAAIAAVNIAYGLEWAGFGSRFDANNDRCLRSNMVITTVDNGAPRNQMHKVMTDAKRLQRRFDIHASARELLLWMDIGNDAYHGQVVITDGRLPTPIYYNGGDYDETPSSGSCSVEASLKSQDLLINDTAAMHGAQLLWQLLRHGYVDYHAVWFNIQKGILKRSPVQLLGQPANTPKR